MCFNDAYFVLKGNITVVRPNKAKRNKAVAFKNNPPFINCISKTIGLKFDNAEDLDVAMLVYNLLDCSKNDRKTTGSLWNYYRDEPSDSFFSNSESFKYKTSITGNTYNVGDGEEGYDGTKDGKDETEVVIRLKYLSSFWRSLNIPIINCEVELILTWPKNCILADMTPASHPPGELSFKITNTKLYVPVVTLSKKDDIKLVEQLKSGWKRTIKWNKYRSQMIVQPQNNNLSYLIDPTFTNVNKLFVLSCARNIIDNDRDSFSDYYVPNVEVKDFNDLIDGKNLFNLRVKNEEEVYEKNYEYE